MKVLITREIPKKGIELLKENGHELFVSKKDGVLSRAELLAILKEFQPEALLCLLTDTIDAEVFDAAPIKICATYSVGFNHIDIKEAQKRGIVVAHTPGVLTNAVSEFTIAAIFSLAKRIVEADKFTRAGNYKGWEPQLLLGDELSYKTIGIVGAGRIGTSVAKRLHHLGFKVIYYDIKENEELKSLGLEYKTLKEIFEESDYLTIHVPLLESTRHLINENTIKRMKDGVKIINTSRGPVIDEKALVKALKSGKVGGAFLDVFENEPNFEEDLRLMQNVILTPHIASATKETREKMSIMAAQSIIDFAKGETPKNIVKID